MKDVKVEYQGNEYTAILNGSFVDVEDDSGNNIFSYSYTQHKGENVLLLVSLYFKGKSIGERVGKEQARLEMRRAIGC